MMKSFLKYSNTHTHRFACYMFAQPIGVLPCV